MLVEHALLILFKDFTTFYNANPISKILSVSHVGATQAKDIDILKKKDKVIIDIVKNAVILYGQDEFIGTIKNAQKVF